jgi:hypothetical protein
LLFLFEAEKSKIHLSHNIDIAVYVFIINAIATHNFIHTKKYQLSNNETKQEQNIPNMKD